MNLRKWGEIVTVQQFNNAVYQAVRILRERAPKDTGNLAYHSIKVEFRGDEAKIYIDNKIAPYMVFTNEMWVSRRWHGKQNPNEGWFDDACAYIANFINNYLHGTLKEKY